MNYKYESVDGKRKIRRIHVVSTLTPKTGTESHDIAALKRAEAKRKRRGERNVDNTLAGGYWYDTPEPPAV